MDLSAGLPLDLGASYLLDCSNGTSLALHQWYCCTLHTIIVRLLLLCHNLTDVHCSTPTELSRQLDLISQKYTIAAVISHTSVKNVAKDALHQSNMGSTKILTIDGHAETSLHALLQRTRDTPQVRNTTNANRIAFLAFSSGSVSLFAIMSKTESQEDRQNHRITQSSRDQSQVRDHEYFARSLLFLPHGCETPRRMLTVQTDNSGRLGNTMIALRRVNLFL